MWVCHALPYTQEGNFWEFLTFYWNLRILDEWTTKLQFAKP